MRITTMMLRRDHPADPSKPTASGTPAGDEAVGPRGRLNLLLSDAGRGGRTVIEQLPRLLAPLGIRCILVHSGDEATDALREGRIHIAVVDMAIPLHRHQPRGAALSFAGGQRILQVLRRLDQPPPTVVVRPPQPVTRESVRGLTQALREGAFAVLDQPVGLETMLETMRRVVRRHYADHWPAA